MSFKKTLLIIWLCLATTSCQDTPLTPPAQTIHLSGRVLALPVYRAKIPPDWQVILPDENQDLTDTTVPICTLKLLKAPEVTITIHNFPSLSLEQRISPAIQIERWKQQIAAGEFQIDAIAYGGFGGYRIEALGIKNAQPIGLIAYSMQMTPVLYRILENRSLLSQQMRADYTIKAIGPPEVIQTHCEDIDAFAESFELIHPIIQNS